jgi:hypothetical protein
LQRMVSSYVDTFAVRAHGGDAARAPRPSGRYPLMLSCRSPYPRWLRRLKWRVFGARPLLQPPREDPPAVL